MRNTEKLLLHPVTVVRMLDFDTLHSPDFLRGTPYEEKSVADYLIEEKGLPVIYPFGPENPRVHPQDLAEWVNDLSEPKKTR